MPRILVSWVLETNGMPAKTSETGREIRAKLEFILTKDQRLHRGKLISQRKDKESNFLHISRMESQENHERALLSPDK